VAIEIVIGAITADKFDLNGERHEGNPNYLQTLRHCQTAYDIIPDRSTEYE